MSKWQKILYTKTYAFNEPNVDEVVLISIRNKTYPAFYNRIQPKSWGFTVVGTPEQEKQEWFADEIDCWMPLPEAPKE